MEQKLVSNEVMPHGEPEPPSYSPTNQQVPFPPHQSYIIQNVPVGTQEGCCGGRSERFRDKVGVSTGVIQIVLALAVIICSIAIMVIRFKDDYEIYYPYMGVAVGNAIVWVLPAGILGACTKKRSSCVIIGYLVMSILAAVHSFPSAGVEALAAAFHSYNSCPEYIDYVIPEDSSLAFDHPYPSCEYGLVVSLTVLHSITAFLTLVEFIVAIIAAAFCCGGLTCCCAGFTPAQRPTVPMTYYPAPICSPQTATPQANVDQGTEPVPSKA